MYILIAIVIIIIIIIIVSASYMMPPSLPAGILNGDSVKCPEDAKIFKIENNRKRWYPNPTIYGKYGSPSFKILSCAVLNSIPSGPDMQ